MFKFSSVHQSALIQCLLTCACLIIYSADRYRAVSGLAIDNQAASASQSVSSSRAYQQQNNYNPRNNEDSNVGSQDTQVLLVPAQAQTPPITQPNLQRSDHKRPIWNIAHMVNSIKELDYRLGMGANAVEADVTFNALGQPTFIYHGPPCDCWRHCHQQEDFDDYLAYVHEIVLAEPSGIGRNLSLLFLDLKLDHLEARAKERAGRELAESVMANLYPRHNSLLASLDKISGKRLRLILSINHVTDVELVNNFIHHLETHNSSDLMQRIGFDVGMNDDLEQIETMWRRFGNNLQVPLNLWQGDGFTNCISPFYNLQRLSRAISKRDSELGYPRKVYQWTIDLHDRMREAFMLGVDAIMTNHPERVLAVLGEAEIGHHFRLATRDDDPFKKIPAKSIYKNNSGARYPRTISPVSGGFLGSLMDVINSWLAYLKEIPYLSLPTTSRFLTKMRRQFKFRSSDNLDGRSSTIFPIINYTSSQTISRSFEGQNQTLLVYKRSTTTATTDKTSSLAETTTPAPSDAKNSTITTTTSSNQDEKIISTTTTTTMISTNDTQIQAKETNSTERVQSYEPKWYTSMASNFLVSMLKLALPVNGTSSATTTTTTTSSPATSSE